MYGAFRTDAEKDEIARKYLEKKKQKKKRVCDKWFPGPACKVSKTDPAQVKAGPDYSALTTLQNSEEWLKEDTRVIEACTVQWVKQCFDEQTELRIAKIPYLHGVLWQNHAVSRDGTNPLMLCDSTGQIEVRLHEVIKARYDKLISENHSEPAILMKHLTLFKSDDGTEFYACCSLENFIHLVAAKNPNATPAYCPFPSSFSLQYGEGNLSELELPLTVDLCSPSAAPPIVYLTPAASLDGRDGESVTQSVLLPRMGASDRGPC